MEILAHIVDELQVIRHYFTAKKGDTMPILFTDLILKGDEPKKKETQGFQSGEAFDEAWNKLVKGGDD